MKNKKTFLWIALIVTAIIPVYAQQYNPESDFKIDWDKNVKNGVIITKYIGTKKEVRIPPSIQDNPVTGIGGEAFNNNDNITKVIIPNSVTSIRDGGRWGSAFSVEYKYYGAFSDCSSLTSVTIPDNVTSIGYFAFNDCSGLTSVIFQGTIAIAGFSYNAPFPGNLRQIFYSTNSTNGTPGTYTRESDSDTWKKM